MSQQIQFLYGKNLLNSSVKVAPGTIYLDLQTKELYYDDPTKPSATVHEKIIDAATLLYSTATTVNFPSQTIVKGWLDTRDGKKFAPATLIDNVFTADGQRYDAVIKNYIDTPINSINSSLQNKLNLTGGTLTGTLNINGNNGITGWVVRRNSNDSESVKLTVDDSYAIFTYTNDEKTNAFKFVLHNTDTESPAASGSEPNTSTVTMQGSAGGSYVTADWFTGSLIGNADTATKLKNARNIFGKSFNGTADIAGQALVYGTYTSTASQRYANGGLQIREAGLVGNAQTDIGYAPSIGFHWSGKKAASLLFHHDGLFYFRAQDGTTRATVDANLQGNASTATALTSSAGSGTQPIYFSNGKPTATTYALHKTVPSNAVFTDANVAQGKSTTANWRPILSHNTYHATYGTDPGGATGSVYYTPSIAIQPSTGTLRATKFIGEFEGTITNAKRLSNYYSTRPTTISPGVTGDGSVITFKCTSSVTDTDDPGDGHVLHFNWDNDGGYDSQILMMTSSSTMKYRGMSGKTWQPWVTSIDSGNYTQYTVKKDGTGASGTWNISISGTASKAIADADGNTIKTTYAKLASMNNLVHSGNEITIVPDGYSGELWLNWRTCGGANGNITKYNFGNGKNGTSGVTLVASNFSGVAAKATTLETARMIFGKSFNGGADVAGSALVYGTYTATANQRYNNAGLQIREADQVLATQSDIGYAPSISFHWGNRIAATLLFHSDGVFYFRKQDGVTRATVDANVAQVNGVIPEWSGSISNADARWIAAWTSDGTKIKALDKNTMTVLGASQATGTTFSIKNASGGDVDLIFDRNTNASWKVLNSQGNLHFQTNWTTSKGGYYDVMKLHYNTGNVEIKGNIKVGGGCTLEYDSSQQSLKFIFT